MDPALFSLSAESASSPAPSTSASASGQQPYPYPSVVLPEGSTRKERNRISAQKSRARRKVEFEALKRRVVDLEAENRALRAACECQCGLGPPVPLLPVPSIGWMQADVDADAIEPPPVYLSAENNTERIRKQDEERGEDHRKKKRRKVEGRGMENQDYGDGDEKANGKKEGMRRAKGKAKAAWVEEIANEMHDHDNEKNSKQKKHQSTSDHGTGEHQRAASLGIDDITPASPVSVPDPAPSFTSSTDFAPFLEGYSVYNGHARSPSSRHSMEKGDPNARRAGVSGMVGHDIQKQPRKRQWTPDHLYSLRRTTRSLKADVPGLYDHVIREREEHERQRSESLDNTDRPSPVSAQEPAASTSLFSWAHPDPTQIPSGRRSLNSNINPVEGATSVELAYPELVLAKETEHLVEGEGEVERDGAPITIPSLPPTTTPTMGRQRSRSVSRSRPRSLSVPREKNGDGDEKNASLDMQGIVQNVDLDEEDAAVLLIQPPPLQQDIEVQTQPQLETETETIVNEDRNMEITMVPAQPLPPPPPPPPQPPVQLLPSSSLGVSSSSSSLQPQKRPLPQPRSTWDQRVRARLNELGSVRVRPQTGVQGRAAQTNRFRNSTGGGSGSIGDQLLLPSNIRNLHRQSLA